MPIGLFNFGISRHFFTPNHFDVPPCGNVLAYFIKSKSLPSFDEADLRSREDPEDPEEDLREGLSKDKSTLTDIKGCGTFGGFGT